MGRITSGGQWRKYARSNQWTAFVTAPPLIALFVWQYGWDADTHQRNHEVYKGFALAGIVLCLFTLVGAGFSRYEVFVDASEGFVSVVWSWLGYVKKQEYAFADVLAVEAYASQPAHSYRYVPRLGLRVAGRSTFVRLDGPTTMAQLRAEATALGELMGKPVNFSDKVALPTA